MVNLCHHDLDTKASSDIYFHWLKIDKLFAPSIYSARQGRARQGKAGQGKVFVLCGRAYS